LHRELVNQKSPYRFGQYLYVTGGDKAPNRLLQYSHVYPKTQLDIQPASAGHLIGVTRTPYGWVARMESQDTNTSKIDSEIQLFDREKKIEFIEDVNKRMKKNLMLDEDGKVVCVQSNAKDVYRLIMGKFAEKLLNGKSIPIVVISESSNV
jgi:hypothetical protein